MGKYVYAFQLVPQEQEMFFQFPKLPEIISAVPFAEFEMMNGPDIYRHAEDAVVTALQARIQTRTDIPEGDRHQLKNAMGFVSLSTLQSMKAELYALYRENFSSVSEFSKMIPKSETSVRRLLDLRHRSVAAEIDEAIALFGKRIVTQLSLEPESASITGNFARPRLLVSTP